MERTAPKLRRRHRQYIKGWEAEQRILDYLATISFATAEEIHAASGFYGTLGSLSAHLTSLRRRGFIDYRIENRYQGTLYWFAAWKGTTVPVVLGSSTKKEIRLDNGDRRHKARVLPASAQMTLPRPDPTPRTPSIASELEATFAEILETFSQLSKIRVIVNGKIVAARYLAEDIYLVEEGS